MKCKGCGANFPSRELTCPYCGRENHRGLSWFSHRQAAEEAYQQALAQSGVSLRRIAANRIVNRVLFGIIALFLLTVLLVFLYFFAAEGLSRLSVALRQDAIYEELDQLYREERFGELYALLDEKDLFGEETYAYSQMALLHRDYLDFQESRLSFFLDEEIDDFTVEYLLSKANDLFSGDIPAYPELTKENLVHLEVYRREAEGFCRGVLGLTEEEMALLYQDYLYYSDEEALAAAILERRAWE